MCIRDRGLYLAWFRVFWCIVRQDPPSGLTCRLFEEKKRHIYIYKKNDSWKMGMSPLKTPVDRSAQNLAVRVSSPTWSPMTIFLAIGPGVLILWGVEFCHFPISRRSPLTQCLRYHAACDIQNVHHWLTHACSCSLTLLSMAFSGKADQINWIACLNSKTVFGFGCSNAACDRLTAFAAKPDNPVGWGRVNWGPLIIGDEVTAIWQVKHKIWNGKNNKYL